MRYCGNIFLPIFLASIALSGSAAAVNPALFTPEEQHWLAEHPQITIVANGFPSPITFWNDPARPAPPPPPVTERDRPSDFAPPVPPRPSQGKQPALPPPKMSGQAEQSLIPVGPAEQNYFQGVAADYLEQVAELTGLTFTVTARTGHGFRAAFAAMERGEADILPALMTGLLTPPRIVLSIPYIEIPVVVVMKADAPYLEDISQLETMNVAGVMPVQPKLDSLGLQNRIRLVNPRDGLVGVATGKYDAFIAEISTVSHELRYRPLTDIKIAGELPAPSAFSVAVSERMQEFIPILNKAIRAIPQEKKDKIWQRWFPVMDERNLKPNRWLWVFGVLSLSGLLIGGLGFFYYRGHLRKIRHGIAALEPHLLCVHTDHTITITGVTAALCRTTGFSEEFLVGKPLKVLGTPEGDGKDVVKLFKSVAQGSTWKGEVKLARRNGGKIWTDVIISPARRKNDEVGFTVIYQDASKRKHYEKLATRDELTGLCNRRHFNALAPELLGRAARNGLRFALFLIDVDNFKQYNDTYGHPAGDKVLVAIGRTLEELFKRDSEACFRLGGEEFGAIALLSSAAELPIVADRLLSSVKDLKVKHRQNPPGIVTVSVGAALSTGDDNLQIEELYRLADANLYRAKESGRDRHVG